MLSVVSTEVDRSNTNRSWPKNNSPSAPDSDPFTLKCPIALLLATTAVPSAIPNPGSLMTKLFPEILKVAGATEVKYRSRTSKSAPSNDTQHKRKSAA